MPDAIPSNTTSSLSGAFLGELHGTLYQPGDPNSGLPVTLGVVVCPACSSLVFSEGWPAHEARHNGGLR